MQATLEGTYLQNQLIFWGGAKSCVGSGEYCVKKDIEIKNYLGSMVGLREKMISMGIN